jgi:hypothetical protein
MNILKPSDNGSPLTLKINSFIDHEWQVLRRDQINPWLHLTVGLTCKDFYGKSITYSGIGFVGSPQMVFWGGYIEPFLKSIIDRSLDYTVQLCVEKTEPLEPALGVAEAFLRRLVCNAYELMSEIDQKLIGKGSSEKTSRRSVERESNAMFSYVAARIRSEILMWKPKPWLTRFYERHPFWFWLATTIISVWSFIRTMGG